MPTKWKNDLDNTIQGAISDYEGNRAEMSGLLKYPTMGGADSPLPENPDLVDDWGYNPNKSVNMRDATTTKPWTEAERRKADRWDRAIGRAGEGKIILDPMYRQELKKQGYARPLLKDYIKDGPGAWIRAMQEWRSTQLENPEEVAHREEIGTLADNSDALGYPATTAETYTAETAQSMPGAMSDEDQNYWANIAQQALNNQWGGK